MNNEIKNVAQELADLFDAVSRLDDLLNTSGESFKDARNSSLLAKKSLAACKRHLEAAMRTMS